MAALFQVHGDMAVVLTQVRAATRQGPKLAIFYKGLDDPHTVTFASDEAAAESLVKLAQGLLELREVGG